jgi:phosphotriesterase-related protein
MSIMTTQGPISSENLGFILPHEHILNDLRNQFREFEEVTRKAFSEQKVGLNNLDVLRRNPWAVKDNLVINDVKTAEEEVLRFKEVGGQVIVDCTNIGLGRDVDALSKISILTGIYIVLGSSYYYQATHPEDMPDKTVKDIRKEIIDDFEKGIDDTDVKAGVIGEIGISEEMHDDEKKVLEASAQAQKEIGAGMHVHIFPWVKKKEDWPLGIEALNILEKNGCITEKVAIGHVDVAIDIKIDYIKEILNRGAFVTFDNFGHEFYIEKKNRLFVPGPFAQDIQRVETIKALIDMGFVSQILVSNDICHKTLLHKFGGWGYDHVITNIIPMMKDYEITEKQIDIIFKKNPVKFLNIK